MMRAMAARLASTIEKKANTNTKTKQESHIGPKNAKTAQYKNITVKTQQYRIITDYGKYFKNKNAKKNRKPQKPPPQKKIYKNTLKKTAETTIYKHETKHKPNKIHNNGLKTNNYRV